MLLDPINVFVKKIFFRPTDPENFQKVTRNMIFFVRPNQLLSNNGDRLSSKFKQYAITGIVGQQIMIMTKKLNIQLFRTCGIQIVCCCRFFYFRWFFGAYHWFLRLIFVPLILKYHSKCDACH